MHLKSFNPSKTSCQALLGNPGQFSNLVDGLCFDIRSNDRTTFVIILLFFPIEFILCLATSVVQSKVSFIDVRRSTMTNISNLIRDIQDLCIRFIGHHLWRISFWVQVQIGQFDCGWLDSINLVWHFPRQITKCFSMQFGHRNQQQCSFALVKRQSKSGIFPRACTIGLFLLHHRWTTMNCRLDPISVAHCSDQVTLTSIAYATDTDVSMEK